MSDTARQCVAIVVNVAMWGVIAICLRMISKGGKQ